MTKEQLFELLKENLIIELNTHPVWDGKGFKVSVSFDGVEICSDSFLIDKDELMR